MSTNTAKFEAGLAKARASLGMFKAAVEGAANSALSLGNALAGGLAVAGAGLGLKAIVGTAIEAEDALARLAKVSDFDAGGLKAFKGELQGLSTELKGVAIEDVRKIAIEGAKLGVASGDLLEYTEGVAKLSVALDDIPADVLTNQIGKINVVFKLGVKGALQLGSAIDKVADSGVSSAADILDVTQRISGSAAAAKMSASDTIALSAALLDTGTNAEAAGTALAKLIQRMTIPEKQAAFAETMGISAEKFAKQIEEGPTAALLRYIDVIKKLDSGGQVVALQEVLGKKNTEQVAAIQKLASVVDTAREYAAAAAHEFETLDNINKSYAINSATTSAALTQMGNRLKVLGDDLGSVFLPPLKAAIDGLGFFASGIKSIGDAIKSLATGDLNALRDLFETFVYGAPLPGRPTGKAGAAPKVDARAAARRAAVAKKAADEAAALAAGGEDEGARELGKKELKDTSKAIGIAATDILAGWNRQQERANELVKQARSPLEKYRDDLAEINKLLKDQNITAAQFAKLKAKLDKEGNPFFAAGAAVGGIGADAAEAAAKRLAEPAPERKLAGAVELGSREARSTVLDYKLNQQGGKKDGLGAVAKNTEKTAREAEKTAIGMGRLLDAIGGAMQRQVQALPI